MRMLGKTCPRGDAVVVQHAQSAELHVFRIEIICERKGKVRVQPAVVKVSTIGALANRNHGCPPNFLCIIHVITTIVKRPILHPLLDPLPQPQASASPSSGHSPRASKCCPGGHFRPPRLWCTVMRTSSIHCIFEDRSW